MPTKVKSYNTKELSVLYKTSYKSMRAWIAKIKGTLGDGFILTNFEMFV